jgi:hypothetical protein
MHFACSLCVHKNKKKHLCHLVLSQLLTYDGFPKDLSESLLHIVPFCEGPNKKSEGFAKEKQKT